MNINFYNCNRINISLLSFTFLFLLYTPGILSAQTPGNVSTNLSLWLKANSGTFADAGATAATDGGNIQQWNDQSGTSKNASQLTAAKMPVYYSGGTNQINYNPLLRFDGTKGMDLSTVLTTGNAPYDVYTVSTTVGDFGVNQTLFFQGNAAGIGEYMQLGYAQVGATTFGALHNWASSPAFSGNNTVSPTLPNLIEYGYNLTSRFTNIRGSNGPATPLGNGLNLTGNSAIGYDSRLSSDFHQGDIAEVIAYTSYRNPTERLKIQSYLAIKYGITLTWNTGVGAGDYYPSSSTAIKVWDHNVSSNVYHNQVIGIARDDNSGLLQKQSHSSDDTTRIYLSTLAATNADNTGSFSANAQFVMVGNNKGQMRGTYLNVEYPTGLGITGRIDREWKITNTNFNGAFSMDFTMNTSPINPADLRILIDDDGDFTNATMYAPVITYNSGVVTVSGIDPAMIPTNSTKFLTIVSINPLTPLPLKLLEFNAAKVEGPAVQLSWKTTDEINTSHFNIERSTGNNIWKVIGKEASFNTAGNHNYAYKDNQPLSGTSYYRLAQVDIDGRTTYSFTRKVEIKQSSQVKIYPNPVIENSFIIEGRGPVAVSGIKISDALGRDIGSLIQLEQLSATKVKVNVSKLASAFYFIRTADWSVSFLKK